MNYSIGRFILWNVSKKDNKALSLTIGYAKQRKIDLINTDYLKLLTEISKEQPNYEIIVLNGAY